MNLFFEKFSIIIKLNYKLIFFKKNNFKYKTILTKTNKITIYYKIYRLKANNKFFLKTNNIKFKKPFFYNNTLFNNFFFQKKELLLMSTLNKKSNFLLMLQVFKNFLTEIEPTLSFITLYKKIILLNKYVMNVLYPSLNFYSFINILHQQRFFFIQNSLDTVLYSSYRFLFSKTYLNYKYIFEIFFNIFRFKKINFLVTYIKNLFKNVNFYKHQFLLFYIRCFFKLFSLDFFKKFGVIGVFLKFHGKIAKAGNSRKKKFLIQYGDISTSYKNNYIVEKFQINSFTGVVGCTAILCFNSK